MFNLKNTNLRKEDAGGWGVLYLRALWMQVLKMRSAKKAAGFETPCGAWMNKMPCQTKLHP